jgi:hypothetical protein
VLAVIAGGEVALPSGTWQIQSITARLTTAGSTTTTVDVNKNGTTIFSSSKVTFASSVEDGSVGSFTGGADSFVGGTDVLSVDIDAVGTGAVSLNIIIALLKIA